MEIKTDERINNDPLTKACCPCRRTSSPQTQRTAARQQAKRYAKKNLQKNKIMKMFNNIPLTQSDFEKIEGSIEREYKGFFWLGFIFFIMAGLIFLNAFILLFLIGTYIIEPETVTIKSIRNFEILYLPLIIVFIFYKTLILLLGNSHDKYTKKVIKKVKEDNVAKTILQLKVLSSRLKTEGGVSGSGSGDSEGWVRHYFDIEKIGAVAIDDDDLKFNENKTHLLFHCISIPTKKHFDREGVHVFKVESLEENREIIFEYNINNAFKDKISQLIGIIKK